MKNTTIGAIIILLIAALFALYVWMRPAEAPESAQVIDETVQTEEVKQTQQQKPARSAQEVIGKSVGGRDIIAYHFGTGEKELLIVGGIHGIYSSNTAKVAEEAIAWLTANPTVIPQNVSVTVVPAVNPDGLTKSGSRFNANNVDLNRNFDCDWKSESMWQNKKVSGGSAAFSEPESKAIQTFIETYKPAAAVVYFSSEGEVYPSGCGGAVLPESVALANTYSQASTYPSNTEDFSHYKINGDMVNWFAKQGIPAISVLLTDHTNTEWKKNEAGITAVLTSLAQ